MKSLKAAEDRLRQQVYVPDLEKMNTWTPPKAEKIGNK